MKKSLLYLIIITLFFTLSCKNQNNNTENNKKEEITADTSENENIEPPNNNPLLKIIAQIPEKQTDFVISIKELSEIKKKSTVSIEKKDLTNFFDDNWFEDKSDFKALFNVRISDNTNLLFFCATVFLGEDFTPENYWFLIVDKKGKIQDCSSAICDYDEIDGYIPDSIKITKKDNQIIFSEIIASDITLCLDTSNMNLSQAEINDLFFYSTFQKIINNKIEINYEQQYNSYQITKTNYSGTIGTQNVDVKFNFDEQRYYSSGNIIFDDGITYTFQSVEPPEMCFSSYANIYSSDGKLVGNMSFLEKNGKIYGQLHFDDISEDLPIKLF